MRIPVSSSSRVASFVRQQFPLSYVLVLLVLVLCVTSQAFGQTATIVGTVTDPSGGAVASANVSVTHVETGQVYQLTSNGEGQYVAAELPIGHYNIKVEAPGFKAAEQKGVVLNCAY